MVEISWLQALGWRLRRQHVTDPSSGLSDTASRLLGLHAQVASSTELIAASRTPSYRLGDVAAGLWEKRSLVRTWGMRGTLHVFPADELPLLVAAFTQRQWPKLTPAWEKYHGVSGDTLRAVTAAIGDILPGRVLTREELGAEIIATVDLPGVDKAVASGWGQLFKPAAAGGLLCSGPDRGRNVTFTHPRTWLPDAPWDEHRDPDVAMATVIARFLDTYGPATLADFARWWGTDPASARRLFKQHADIMVDVIVEGERYSMTPGGAESVVGVDGDAVSGVWLLPGFDPYVIAPLSHRTQTVPEGYVDRVSRTAGWISPVVVVDGVVRAVWSHELKDGRLTITVEPFGRFAPATTKAVTGAAGRYGDLFDADVELHWSEPA